MEPSSLLPLVVPVISEVVKSPLAHGLLQYLVTEPVVIVKRDEGGLAFDTGLQTEEGSPLVVWPLHCGNHQLWQFDRQADKFDRQADKAFSIRSLATGLVLGAEEIAVGTAVTMQEWKGKQWQMWHINQAAPTRTYWISSAEPRLSNLSMDVPIDAAPGGPVQLWETADAQQQMFMLLRTKY